MTAHENSIIIIGMGNPLLSDDTVGLLVIDELKKRPSAKRVHLDFKKNYSGGMDLLDDLIDIEKAIIVDSIKTGRERPGYCHEFTIENIDEITQPRIVDAHSLDLLTVLETGERCGFSIPKEIRIIGIEGTEYSEFSEKPTPAVMQGMELAIEKIIKQINAWCHDDVMV